MVILWCWGTISTIFTYKLNQITYKTSTNIYFEKSITAGGIIRQQRLAGPLEIRLWEVIIMDRASHGRVMTITDYSIVTLRYTDFIVLLLFNFIASTSLRWALVYLVEATLRLYRQSVIPAKVFRTIVGQFFRGNIRLDSGFTFCALILFKNAP